jgi:hypothetical protein
MDLLTERFAVDPGSLRCAGMQLAREAQILAQGALSRLKGAGPGGRVI